MKNFKVSFILFFILGTCWAQITPSSSDTTPTPNRWVFGASAGLGFGNNDYFGFNISPAVGYMVGHGLEVGATAGYQYSKDNYSKVNLFSAGPYVHYSFIPQFFGRAHYEYYTGNIDYKNSDYQNNISESALWVGGGYQSFGRVGFRAGIMYNVLHSNKSIFSSNIRPFAGVVFSL